MKVLDKGSRMMIARDGHLLRRMMKTTVYFVLYWSRWTLVLLHVVSFCRVIVVDIEQQLMEVRLH